MEIIKSRLLLFILIVAHSAAYADDGYQPPISVVRTITTLTVAADASYEQIIEYTQRIETEEGAVDYGESTIPYSSGLEDLEILDAYIIQPDGKRITVPRSAILDKGDPISDSAMFSDTKYKVIIYPDVRVGSRMYYKVRVVRHTPEFPGQFYYSDIYSPNFRYDHEEVNLIFSDKLPMQVDTMGMRGGRLPDENGQHHYRYVFEQKDALPPEPMQVDIMDYAPYFSASTFPDQIALGKAYQDRARPRARVTPAIQKLADEITLNIEDKRDQAKVLYYWVAKNIRYVAINLGAGGLVPHDAQTVLDNRYGDCKDHVVLLEALLDVKGIASSPALINLGNAYRLPKLAVVDPLNHVITYIPGLDMYLDSTAQFAPFGSLPLEDMDKPVILTLINKLGRTPELRANDHVLKSEVSLKMLPDGSFNGTSHSTSTGWLEIDHREIRFSSMDSTNEQLIGQRLGSYGETGIGKITSIDPQDFNGPYEEHTSFTIDATSNVPGPAGLTIPVGAVPDSIADFVNKPPKQVHFPATCNTRTIQEHYVLEFPDNIKITSIPGNTSYDDGVVSYSSQYKLEGSVLDILRELKADRPGRVCGEDDIEKLEQVFRIIQRDLRAQVIYL